MPRAFRCCRSSPASTDARSRGTPHPSVSISSLKRPRLPAAPLERGEVQMGSKILARLPASLPTLRAAPGWLWLVIAFVLVSASGLVASLGRPGGNVTGATQLNVEV